MRPRRGELSPRAEREHADRSRHGRERLKDGTPSDDDYAAAGPRPKSKRYARRDSKLPKSRRSTRLEDDVILFRQPPGST